MPSLSARYRQAVQKSIEDRVAEAAKATPEQFPLDDRQISTIIKWAEGAIRKRERNLETSTFIPEPGRYDANLAAIQNAQKIIDTLLDYQEGN